MQFEEKWALIDANLPRAHRFSAKLNKAFWRGSLSGRPYGRLGGTAAPGTLDNRTTTATATAAAAAAAARQKKRAALAKRGDTGAPLHAFDAADEKNRVRAEEAANAMIEADDVSKTWLVDQSFVHERLLAHEKFTTDDLQTFPARTLLLEMAQRKPKLFDVKSRANKATERSILLSLFFIVLHCRRVKIR